MNFKEFTNEYIEAVTKGFCLADIPESEPTISKTVMYEKEIDILVKMLGAEVLSDDLLESIKKEMEDNFKTGLENGYSIKDQLKICEMFTNKTNKSNILVMEFFEKLLKKTD